MSCEVIEFISFLTDGIAKKNATSGTRGKFMGDMHSSSIGKTCKDSKMRIRREFSKSLSKGVW
jgi:hypothetical protein